jgi:hypothetical protein
MANIVVAKATWVSGGSATNMQPGISHSWIWGLGNVNEAITLTAHPSNTFNTTSITVENVQISLTSDGRPLAYFTVRNTGSFPIEIYIVIGSFIS